MVADLTQCTEWKQPQKQRLVSPLPVYSPFLCIYPRSPSSLPSHYTVYAVLSPFLTLFSCFKCLSQWKSCWRNMVRQTTIQWTRTSPSSSWVSSVYWVLIGIIC